MLDELDLNKISLTYLHKDPTQSYYYHAQFRGEQSEAKSVMSKVTGFKDTEFGSKGSLISMQSFTFLRRSYTLFRRSLENVPWKRSQRKSNIISIKFG